MPPRSISSVQMRQRRGRGRPGSLGRSWEGPVNYVARKVGPDRYFVNWQRPERTEFITVYYDFGQRVMYTSALLEGRDRHFESAKIVELKRP